MWQNLVNQTCQLGKKKKRNITTKINTCFKSEKKVANTISKVLQGKRQILQLQNITQNMTCSVVYINFLYVLTLYCMAVEPHDKAAKAFPFPQRGNKYSSPNEIGWMNEILTDTSSVSSHQHTQAHSDRSNPIVPYSLASEPFSLFSLSADFLHGCSTQTQ